MLIRCKGGYSLPKDMADRLLAGEPPLLVFRTLCDLSLEELANCSGIGVDTLRACERGEQLIGEADLPKLAAALGVTPDDLTPWR